MTGMGMGIGIGVSPAPAAAGLTEFYTEIYLMTVSGAANTQVQFEENSSGTANTRTVYDTINVVASLTVVENTVERRVIDFARLTGYTLTFKANVNVQSGTGTYALRNITDASDLATISTSSTTKVAVESSAITVPAAEKTVGFEIQNTLTVRSMDMSDPMLRVKAG